MIRGVVLHENGPVTIQKNPLQVWRIQWLFFPPPGLWLKAQALHGNYNNELFLLPHTEKRISDTKTLKRDVKSSVSGAVRTLGEQTPANYE